MNSNCIVTQVHIPDFDVQGGLTANDKLSLVEFGLKHLRLFNPSSRIILCGHGHRPRNTDLCDVVFWDDRCYPLNEHGYVVGMPAQYKSVYKGLAEASRLGYSHCLKTRGDCIIGIPNAIDYMSGILTRENRRLLVTQQTGPERMGDCLMFGETDLLCRTWHTDNQVYHSDGLQNTAHHYRRALTDLTTDWTTLVKATCSFRDVHHLKFTCLRWNWRSLTDKLESLVDPAFDFVPYHWGRANGWHYFAADGTMTGTADWMWSEKEFYR